MSAIKTYIESTVPRYVYLYEKNFMERPKPSPAVAFKQAKQNLKSQLAVSTSQEQLNNLSSWYQQGIDMLTNLSKQNSESQRLQEKIIEKLEERFGINLEEIFDFDFSKGAVTAKAGTSQSISRERKFRQQGQLSNRGAVNNRIKKIINNLEEAMKGAPENRAELEKAKQKIIEIKKAFNQLFSGGTLAAAADTLKEAGISFSTSKGESFFKNVSGQVRGNRIDYETTNAFIKILNGVIASFSKNILGHIQGIFEEYILHAIEALRDRAAGNALDEFEKNLMKGGQCQIEGTVEVFDPEQALKIIEDINRRGKVSEDAIKGTIKISNYSSSQKADITITLEGDAFPISVKNYEQKSGKRFHLQSESPLTNFLFGQNNPNLHYGSYYLNILSEHDKEGSHPNYKQVKEEGLKTLVLTMLWQAFSGKGLGKKSGSAEIFAWNNPKTGEIKFFDINSILQQIISKDDMTAMGRIIKPALNTINLKNQKVNQSAGLSQNEAILRRLGQVYAEMQSKKMSISIPQSMLNNIIPTIG